MNDLAARIIRYMHALSYRVAVGSKNYNIVYVEGMNVDGTLNPDAPNCFNDRRLVIQVLNDQPTIIGNWEGTTEPGNHYTLHPINAFGAARIAFGQYTAWQVGMHGKGDRHEALVQVCNVKVHRDLNKDMQRTGDRTDTGLFGINQHWGYDLPLNNIANASAGCLLGRTRSGHREFMQLIKGDFRYQRDRSFIFTTTVIAGDDLVKRSG
jgi:hypothetical protein